MPLIFWAAVGWVAATSVGLRGVVCAPVSLAFAALVALRWFRSHAVLGLALLGATGAMLGADLRAHDARCLAELRGRRGWTVRLVDEAAPGGFARAKAREGACKTAVALAVR